MPSLTNFNIHFTPNWRMTLLTLISLLIFLRLGFWQLERADEKKQLLAAQKSFSQRPALLWQPNMSLPKQFQPLAVQGHFLPLVLLLDNQHHEHQFGYNVISPLLLKNNHIILIDRGWVSGEPSRRVFPQVKSPGNSIQIVGSAYYPSEKSMVLGPVLENKNTNLVIVERVDIKLIRELLHKSVYPFIIRLNKEEANGYIREWAAVSMPPERHYAYALQWFAIALVIFLLFIGLNIKKKHENCT